MWFSIMEDTNYWLTWMSICLLVLVLITSLSKKANYLVKMVLLYASYIGIGFVLIPYGIWNFNQPMKSCLLAKNILRPISYLLGLKWTLRGQENVDPSKGYVVICNHQSALDVIAATRVWHMFGKCSMVAKRELMYMGPFGLGTYLCGTIFVDRASSEAGRAAVNRAGQQAKESGTSLFFFPEGTRHRGGQGKLLPFKKGAFHVAVDAKMPILPVIVSEYEFLGPNRREKFEHGQVDMEILEAIPTENVTKENLNQLIDETRNKMIEALAKLRASNNNSINTHVE